MDIKEILKTVDHTLLATTATESEIASLCDDAVKYSTASVCVSPCHVAFASEYLAGRVPVCTVVGFPSGCTTTASKCFETEEAVRNGASEIDMVANLGYIKSGEYDRVLSDIVAVRNSCEGRILKVIVETCLLTDEEKKRMCSVVAESGADFIKTSTGFSKYGATHDDVKLLTDNSPEGLLVKAAGGISSVDDAVDFLSLGASRLGTSRLVKIAKEMGI